MNFANPYTEFDTKIKTLISIYDPGHLEKK